MSLVPKSLSLELAPWKSIIMTHVTHTRVETHVKVCKYGNAKLDAYRHVHMYTIRCI